MQEYQRAVVLLKERRVAVRSPASLLPTRVSERVASQIPWRFTVSHHTRCWEFFNVRPSGRSENPHETQTKYCQWDEAFRRYVYTEAWVAKLVEELSNEERFRDITGLAAMGEVTAVFLRLLSFPSTTRGYDDDREEASRPVRPLWDWLL